MYTAIVQTRDINIQVSSLLFDSINSEKTSYQYKNQFYKIVINTWTIYLQEQTFLISCQSMILPLYLRHGPNLHFFPTPHLCTDPAFRENQLPPIWKWHLQERRWTQIRTSLPHHLLLLVKVEGKGKGRKEQTNTQ